MILEYFQDECFRCITRYASELRGLIKEVTSWSDPRAGKLLLLEYLFLTRGLTYPEKYSKRCRVGSRSSGTCNRLSIKRTRDDIHSLRAAWAWLFPSTTKWHQPRLEDKL